MEEEEKLVKIKKKSNGEERMTDLIRGTMLLAPESKYFLEAYRHLCSCK